MKSTLIGIIVLILAAIVPLYLLRAPLVEKYDFKYVEDHLHHSQWEIPKSYWGIGDDGLYQYAGYQLASGADPYSINAEAPPFGKYLFGFSIRLFNNPYFSIIPIYFITLFAFYFLTSFFISAKKWRIFATISLISSPLFFSQLGTTTLDLLQTCLLVLHTLAIFNLTKKNKTLRKILLIIASGVTLGLFIGTKFGVLGPVTILADAVLLWRQKKILYLFPLVIISACVYVGLYSAHFINGGNLITFLKGQKWILNYWLNNQPKTIPLFIFVTLFSGWWTNMQFFKEWTIILTISTAAFLGNCYFILKKKLSDPYTIYISIFLVLFLLIFSFNFYWVRYLIVPLPFLIIFFTKFVAKRNIITIGIVSVLAVLSSFYFLFFTIENTKNEIKYAWEKGIYKDLYNYLPADFQKKYSRNEFDEISSSIELGLNLPSKKVDFSPKGNVLISYHTSVGQFSNEQPVNFISENGRFKLDWKWTLLLPNFVPGDHVTIVPEPFAPGPVLGQDGKILSIWGDRSFVFAKPEKINHTEREKLLNVLAEATNGSKEDLRILLYVRSRKNWVVPIDFLTGRLKSNSDAFLVQKKPARIFSSLECKKIISKNGIQTGGDIILTTKLGITKNLSHKWIGC